MCVGCIGRFFLFFFFFKQKTAYGVRIRDWSSDVCSSDLVEAPIYSHVDYDVVPERKIVVQSPDIVIVEGLNVLQPARVREDGKTGLAVSDFFDFSVYVDAATSDIERWYVERFLRLRETSFRDPSSYHTKYADLTVEEIGRAHVCTPVTNEHLVCRL